jgi:hypothetical protein
MNRTLALALLALAAPAHADIVYSGTLGRQPIHLVLEDYSDGVVSAMYVYDRHDTPIALYGRAKDGVVVLHEKDGERDVATLRFEGFAREHPTLAGTWSPVEGGKSLPISLRRDFDLERYSPMFDDAPVEILQGASTPEHYFKVSFLPDDRDRRPYAAAVSVYRKRTDQWLQTFEVEAQPRGFQGVEVGDFNFDGVPDFSLFQHSHAGPNTSTLYFLKKPATGMYVLSDISGISLEFDAKAKRVHERNQSRAGASVMNATYRVVDDKLVLESRECLEMTEDGDMEELDCGDYE